MMSITCRKVRNKAAHLHHPTCDVEVDLDLLVSGGAGDLAVPLGAAVGLDAPVLSPGGPLAVRGVA